MLSRELSRFPAPLIEWKIYAELGSLRKKTGDSQEATIAYSRASAIVERIAAGVYEQELRQTFLESREVLEVMIGMSPCEA